MSATIVPKNNLHYPVLLKEVLSIISPQNGGTFIDCTFGQGGYSKKILQFPKAKVIAFDRDQKSKFIGEHRALENLKKTVIIRPSVVCGPEDNFTNLFSKLSI